MCRCEDSSSLSGPVPSTSRSLGSAGLYNRCLDCTCTRNHNRSSFSHRSCLGHLRSASEIKDSAPRWDMSCGLYWWFCLSYSARSGKVIPSSGISIVLTSWYVCGKLLAGAATCSDILAKSDMSYTRYVPLNSYPGFNSYPTKIPVLDCGPHFLGLKRSDVSDCLYISLHPKGNRCPRNSFEPWWNFVYRDCPSESGLMLSLTQ